MNNKVLVEISVPAAAQKYDVYIPLNIKMSEVVKMVASALSDLSDGKYKATEDSILCNADTGEIFNVNIEVAELGINNGSRLMLI
ncbi:MAG: methyltransferase [Ruminococcus sp.]|nr:methyltransferase [Ruminococcus sp.]